MRLYRSGILGITISLGLFVAMQAVIEAGRQLGQREIAQHGTSVLTGASGVADVVYSLLALLIGFAFHGAAGRFENRRSLIVRQVEAIEIAWSRLSTLPSAARRESRRLVNRWLDALLAWYADPSSVRGALLEPPELVDARRTLWETAVRGSLGPGGEPARMLVLPALNDMFGAAEKERLARRIHLPPAILIMIVGIALVAALFAGHGLAGSPVRNWTYTVGIAGTVSFALWVILELEFPRAGLIRMDALDQTLAELGTKNRLHAMDESIEELLDPKRWEDKQAEDHAVRGKSD